MRCVHCGADKSEHSPAANGGLDCPPREDGKVLCITGGATIGAFWPGDDEHYCVTREWRDPEPKTPLDVLRIAAGLKP